MKKRIYGITYNTKTAELICSRKSLDKNKGEPGWFEEGLYRTKKSGNYFIHGVGSQLTTWQQRFPDGTLIGGEDIFPATEYQAKLYIEGRIDPGDIRHAYRASRQFKCDPDSYIYLIGEPFPEERPLVRKTRTKSKTC